MLFAKMAEKRNVTDLIMNVGAGGGGGAPVSAAAPAAGGDAVAAAPAAEEKKKVGEIAAINKYFFFCLVQLVSKHFFGKIYCGCRKKWQKRVMVIWVSACSTKQEAIAYVFFLLLVGCFIQLRHAMFCLVATSFPQVLVVFLNHTVCVSQVYRAKPSGSLTFSLYFLL